MSFMPSPGSVVRLKSGAIALITHITPLGDGDTAWDGQDEFPISVDDIASIIWETG